LRIKTFLDELYLYGKIPVDVRPADAADFAATKTWQTNWTSEYVDALPNKVALYRKDNEELLA